MRSNTRRACCALTKFSSILRAWANDSSLAQKELENAEKRKENVQGKIRFNENLQGKRVVIIDDIATTKASLIACTKAVVASGASQVTSIVLGRNQPSVSYHSGHIPILTCPSCGNPLRLLFGSKTLEPFWGKCICGFSPSNGYAMSIAKMRAETNEEEYATKDDSWPIEFE